MEINDTTEPHQENKMRSFPRGLYRTLLIILAVIVVATVIILMNKKGDQAAQEARKTEIRENLHEYVRVSNNDPTTDALGGISNLIVSVENKTEYRIDQVEVIVEYYKTIGELYKSETVYLRDIEPHSVVSVKAPDSDRGTTVKLKTGRVQSTDLNL